MVMSNKKQLITVCALIHKKVDGDNKIFLAKRAETKQFLPGVWVSEHDIQKAYTATKGQDDKEFVIARRGLGILNGQPLRFS